jgi:hypothetical protein
MLDQHHGDSLPAGRRFSRSFFRSGSRIITAAGAECVRRAYYALMASSDWNFDTPGPVPTVKPNDVRVAWEVFAATRAERKEGWIGISATAFADRCDSASNIEAIAVRAMIVATELQMGALDKWRKDDGLDDRVFEVAATCSITRSADGLDVTDFDETLGERPD